MLRKIFGFMTEELAGEWSKYVARGFILRAPHQTTLFFFFIRHCNPCGFWPAQLSFSILSSKVFTECRCQRHVKPPNLEDQWLEGSNSRHQVSPSSETTRANPSSGRWKYGWEICREFYRKWRLPRHFWVLLRTALGSCLLCLGLNSPLLVGFGLLNWRWAFSSGRFLESAVASGTSNPKLGGPVIRTFQLTPPGVPQVWNDASEPQQRKVEIWARNLSRILPKVATSTLLLGSFTCRKFTVAGHLYLFRYP